MNGTYLGTVERVNIYTEATTDDQLNDILFVVVKYLKLSSVREDINTTQPTQHPHSSIASPPPLVLPLPVLF